MKNRNPGKLRTWNKSGDQEKSITHRESGETQEIENSPRPRVRQGDRRRIIPTNHIIYRPDIKRTSEASPLSRRGTVTRTSQRGSAIFAYFLGKRQVVMHFPMGTFKYHCRISRYFDKARDAFHNFFRLNMDCGHFFNRHSASKI
jgi:hypothetical protein